jgi:hypothetical protein
VPSGSSDSRKSGTVLGGVAAPWIVEVSSYIGSGSTLFSVILMIL